MNFLREMRNTDKHGQTRTVRDNTDEHGHLPMLQPSLPQPTLTPSPVRARPCVHDRPCQSVPVRVSPYLSLLLPLLLFTPLLQAAPTISFRHDVLPILSKAGCNGGGCHGAIAGKGGFRLSLNAYDPTSDHYNITRHANSRRIEPADPSRSLLLTKPTAALKHKGGKVLHEDSPDYKTLATWIQQGAPGPSQDDPIIDHIEISPPHSLLKKGKEQPFKVTALFSNGSKRDVTPWTLFTSTDATLAKIDNKTGKATVLGYGEGAITAWYSSQIAIARITSPWPRKSTTTKFLPPRNIIDEKINDQLIQLNLPTSKPATDSEFIRRAYLDTIGILPTPEETRTFLSDDSPDKHDKLINHLLERPEFVDYWTYRLSDIFLVTGKKLRPDAVKAYYQWIRKQVANNTPWDEITRQVVTAKGESTKNGATNFYALHQDPENMAENISQAFMGLSINCAKCHNHPLEKWTNDQYYSFANLFARVRAKGWGGDARSGDGHRTLYVASTGDLIQPRTGKPRPPAPLDATPIPQHDTQDRREILAEWMTSPNNPYFTRSIANRIWAAFFGIGIVNQVDDLRTTNPASNEPLLEALSQHLVDHQYDLKSLMRLILRSNAYRRSSVPVPGNEDDTKFFSRYYPRRLMAETLYDAITSVTQAKTKFNKITISDGSTQDTKFYKEGTRALQLYDSAVTSYFLKTFGRNEREITCECERSDKPSMVQILHLSNGDTLNKQLNAKNSCVSPLLDKDANDILDEAYLLCVSRFPTEKERSQLQKLLAEAKGDEKRTIIEDLFWALMTSREFLFQH